MPQAGRTNRQHDTGCSSGGDERTTEYVTRDVDEETAKPGRLAWEMTIEQTSSCHAGHGTHKAQLDKRRQNEHGQANRGGTRVAHERTHRAAGERQARRDHGHESRQRRMAAREWEGEQEKGKPQGGENRRTFGDKP